MARCIFAVLVCSNNHNNHKIILIQSNLNKYWRRPESNGCRRIGHSTQNQTLVSTLIVQQYGSTQIKATISYSMWVRSSQNLIEAHMSKFRTRSSFTASA